MITISCFLLYQISINKGKWGNCAYLNGNRFTNNTIVDNLNGIIVIVLGKNKVFKAEYC